MAWIVKKTALLITIGISLSISASAALLYLLLKKENEDELECSQMLDVKTSRQTIIHVKVPKNIVGAVIGRGGSNVKEIQQKTNTKINFEDPVQDESSADRIAVIRGSVEAAREAENLINQLIIEQPEIFTEEIFIPVRACGRIIGRNGDNIRHICQVSRAKVVVDNAGNDSDNNLRRVTIRGDREQIDMAISMIDEKIAEGEIYQQKTELSSAGRPKRYQGRLQIDAAPSGVQNSEEKFMQERLIPVAGDGFLEVYVSAVDTAGHFWVQTVGTKSVQLDKMVEEMTDFYSQSCNRDMMLVDKAAVGDIVAAPFSHDTSWYRARVTQVDDDSYSTSDSKVTLFYVDFGDVGELQLKDICSLKPEFMIMPLQAVECYLANIRPNGGDWQEEATDLFEQLTYAAQWKVLMAKPISQGKTGESGTHVELFDTNGPKDINIAEELIRRGFALWDKKKK